MNWIRRKNPSLGREVSAIKPHAVGSSSAKKHNRRVWVWIRLLLTDMVYRKIDL